MSNPILRTTQLAKRYRTKPVLDGLNLSLDSGGIYGLVGNNGAGKTTLFRILAGTIFPSSGAFSIFGETTTSGLNKARKRMGFLIDRPVYSPNMTAAFNLRNIQLLLGEQSKDRIAETLALVGLDPSSRQPMRTYSMGMLQRYGLAAALIGDPDLLILDEPLNGLDPASTREINALLLSLQKQGKTIILSSHLLTELHKVASDFIFLDKGKLIQQLSRHALDHLCDFALTVHTPEPERAAKALASALPDIDEIHINSDGDLILPHCTQSPNRIVMALQAENINGNVNAQGIGLEDYFIDLIKASQKVPKDLSY